MSKLVIACIIVLFCIFSILLGSREVLHGDYYFLSDHARDLLLVKDIAVNHKLTLIGSHSGLGGVFHGPLWLYLLTIPFFIANGNPFLLPIMNILVGCAVIVGGYFVGKKLYGFRTGLFLAFILTVTPRIWSYYAIGFGVNVIPLVYLFLFYFLISIIRGKKNMLPFAVFFAALTFQFETAAALILFPTLALSFFLQRKFTFSLRELGISIGVFIAAMSSFIVFDLRHTFLISQSLVNLFRHDIANPQYLTIFERLPAHFSSLVGVYTAVFISPNKLLYLIGLSVLFLACYRIARNSTQKKMYRSEVIYLFLFPICMFMFFIFYPYHVYPEYVLGLVIPVAIGCALLLELHWTWNNLGKILVGLCIGISLWIGILHIQFDYGQKHTTILTAGSYQNQKNVVDWIFRDAKGKPFGYFVYVPETFTYGIDYLFWWMGKNSYGYIPESKKIETTYLILYPPLGNDVHAHEFWKKNTIKTSAKASEITKFNGEIIVEKIRPEVHEEPVAPTYFQNLIFR